MHHGIFPENAPNYPLRVPCKQCGSKIGYVSTKNGQDRVYCDQSHFQYCAPKTETGRKERTVTTVHNGIKPKQRVRILQRACSRCEICGTSENIHVGHVVSVEDGLKQGLTEFEINSDENLIAQCAECNLGLGSETIHLKTYVRILKARLRKSE